MDPLRDRITLDGTLLAWQEERRYVAYHKPAGVLVSRLSQGGNPTLFQKLGSQARGLHAVGRLDLPSEGLILLTDDGPLAEALLHPRTRLARIYRVWVTPIPTPADMRALRKGSEIDGVDVRPSRATLEGSDRGAGVLLIEISEGKKREIRRLARAAGLDVRRLVRIQFGPIRLGALPPGKTRPLTGAEVRALRRDTLAPANRRTPRGA